MPGPFMSEFPYFAEDLIIRLRGALLHKRPSIQRILAYLGEPAQAPRIAPTARGPPWQEH